MKNSSYNPGIVDKNDPRYSWLNGYDNSPMLSLLRVFHTLDLGNSYMVLEIDSPLDLNKVKVGDYVYFGNSKGTVRSLLYNEVEDPVGSGNMVQGDTVVGLGILRELNYLTKEQRLNPTAYGYNSQGTGIEMNYYLYQADSIRKNKNGEGALFLYAGSFYIVRQRKDSDVSSLPSVWKSIQEYQEKF